MQCDKCRDEAVLFQAYSGRHLCGRHLAADIEVRAKRSIRAHRWMRPGDHIAVPVSGDRKTAALLCFLQRLTAARRDICLSAVPACTGEGETPAAREAAAMKVALSLRVPCGDMPVPGMSKTTACKSVTKIALAISLDDIAEGVLGEFLFGNAGRLVLPRPAGSGAVPVICPFISVPSDELDLYGEIEGTGIALQPVMPAKDALLQETEPLLREYTARHPATKYALLHLGEQLSGGDVTALTAIVSGRGGLVFRDFPGEVP